ncbi:unnamed protein product [Caenorhabditis angaria]|uniref:Neurotransmitter-gated ion-channel ligand-binding domain-containing protein n=1 Tax=Caenorhabditis angaria TaxID=860376 RepID=A0A9P1IQP1_9PELO|nr:unnamed protein product [Caenorhabditis angaria]
MRKNPLLLYLILIIFADVSNSLTQTELNELSRKFKYYHAAVRPASPDNFVTNRNGTFFNVPVEMHILATRIINRSLYVECIIKLEWIDERLKLRELFDHLTLPAEFSAWHPSLIYSPTPTSKYSSLNPTVGQLATFITIKTSLDCTATAWKYPFESFSCPISISSEGDEALIITRVVDLRDPTQKLLASISISDYPLCLIELCFKAEWPRAVLSSFLPSILIISSVFLAQWKRRKIQILVSLAAMIGILIMLCSTRPYTAATLMDLWLCATFIHSIFLVLIDLTLPARRVRYTLMVHVDETTQQAKPYKIMTRSEIENPGPFRYVNHVIDYLTKREMTPKTTIVTASPGATPIQRQITTAMLGNRKRVALSIIAISYFCFLLFYAIIVLVID